MCLDGKGINAKSTAAPAYPDVDVLGPESCRTTLEMKLKLRERERVCVRLSAMARDLGRFDGQIHFLE